MRLKKENILMVLQLQKDGLTYEYIVTLKGNIKRFYNKYSNGDLYKGFYYRNKNAEYYSFYSLPKTVQKFIEENYESGTFSKTEDFDGLYKYEYYSFGKFY